MAKEQEWIKQGNIELVLRTLLEYQPVTRKEIAKYTTMSLASITRIVTFLKEKGVVGEQKVDFPSAGRNTSKLSILDNSLYAVGIEIHAKKVAFVLLGFDRMCVAVKEYARDVKACTNEEFIACISEGIEQLREECGIAYDKIIGIGVSVPGIVNPEKGIIEVSTQLDWTRKDVKRSLEQKLCKPLILENDAKAKMIGLKYQSDLSETKEIASLFIGDGVSGVASQKGSILRGVYNAAGEVGHIPLPLSKDKCDCGNIGCLQTKLARKFLLQKANEEDESISTLQEIYLASCDGIEWAKNLLKEFRDAMIIALNILQGCYNPQEVLLSGEVVVELREEVEHIIEAYRKSNQNSFREMEVSISCDTGYMSARGVGIEALNFLTKHID